jgi:hypothetical protein
MAATTTLLGLVTPTQGTLSGTWGDTVNYGISDYVDIAIAGTLSFSGDGAITLLNTTGSASGNGFTTTTAQYMVIRITGTQTVTKVITGPSYSKLYMVDHAGATSAVTFKAAGQTGVTVAVGEKCFVYYNGTDYIKIATSTAGSGTVTAVSVVSANGLAGTSSGGATPALTLSTSITGVLKGNATAISAATAGTDYLAPPSGTAILKANSGGALANATAGTDYVAPGGALGTPSSGTLSSCTVDGTNEVGFKNIPQNAQNSASYTLTLADAGKHIYRSTGGAETWTIPAASSVAYPLGTAITFVNLSTTAVSIAITTDTMYLSSAGTTGTRTLAQFGSATAIKVSGVSSSGIWLISGSGLT